MYTYVYIYVYIYIYIYIPGAFLLSGGIPPPLPNRTRLESRSPGAPNAALRIGRGDPLKTTPTHFPTPEMDPRGVMQCRVWRILQP